MHSFHNNQNCSTNKNGRKELDFRMEFLPYVINCAHKSTVVAGNKWFPIGIPCP